MGVVGIKLPPLSPSSAKAVNFAKYVPESLNLLEGGARQRAISSFRNRSLM